MRASILEAMSSQSLVMESPWGVVCPLSSWGVVFPLSSWGVGGSGYDLSR